MILIASPAILRYHEWEITISILLFNIKNVVNSVLDYVIIYIIFYFVYWYCSIYIWKKNILIDGISKSEIDCNLCFIFVYIYDRWIGWYFSLLIGIIIILFHVIHYHFFFFNLIIALYNVEIVRFTDIPFVRNIHLNMVVGDSIKLIWLW